MGFFAVGALEKSQPNSTCCPQIEALAGALMGATRASGTGTKSDEAPGALKGVAGELAPSKRRLRRDQ